MQNDSSIKSHVSVCLIGNMYAGKSTLVGRLITSLGTLSERQQLNIKSFTARYELLPHHKDAWLAYVADRSRDERYRKMTCRSRVFGLPIVDSPLSIIDSPGCHRYLRSTIKAMTMADCAMIVIDVNDDNIDDSKATIAYGVGIRQLIVVINKMDTVNWEKNVYDRVRFKWISMLTIIGYGINDIIIIPVSVLHDDNISISTNNMPWYQSLSLIDALKIVKSSVRRFDAPFRMQVLRVDKITGAGVVVSGRVLSGSIGVSQRIKFGENYEEQEIKSIQIWDKMVDVACAGDMVGLAVTGRKPYRTPQFCYESKYNWCIDEDLRVTEALTRVRMHNLKQPLKPGFIGTVYMNGSRTPGRIVQIVASINQDAEEKVEESLSELSAGKEYSVHFEFLNPIPAANLYEYGRLGRFVFLHSKAHLASGYIETSLKTVSH